MKGRIPANSESLKKHFPEVYKNLFSKCPIVVSAPGSFWWTGEYAAENGGLAILQKIPPRAYVGIEPASPNIIRVGTYTFYLPPQKKFIVSALEEPLATKLLTLLSELPETQKKGFILHILTETSPGCGLNTSGAFSTALALVFNLFYEKITPPDLNLWQKLDTQSLLSNQKFDQVFRLAWKFESIPHADAATGATVFVPFISGTYPVVYWTSPQSWDLSTGKDTWPSRYSFVDSAQYSGIRLDELFNLTKQPFWPVDFALIYSGETRTTTLTFNSTIENIEELAEIRQNLTLVEKKLANLKIVPAIYTMVKNLKGNQTSDALWDMLTNPIALNSLAILFGFQEIFEKGLSQQTLRSFFKHINRNQDLLSALGLSSPVVDSICQILRSEIKDLGDDYGCATKITGGGIRGDVLFTCVYHGLRDQIDRVVGRLRKETRENIFLDYASWLDGIEDEGLRLEQFLTGKIYSDFISPGSIQAKKVSAGTTISELYTLDQFNKQKKQMNLLLDCLDEEIYIKGEEISSRDLPSSTMAIKVLQILLARSGKEVKNSQFPQSSYSQDRNEFQSKIASPLVKVIQKKLKKKLPLEVHGALDDFTVTLNQPPFDIYLLEKTF